ncbi:MAG: hypothetical protein ABEJ26_05440 [Halosimplex sp.]
MRYLFLINTPAQAHLYRNAVSALSDRGHEVEVFARDYGCTLDLLEWYEIPYDVYGRCDTSKGSLFRQLPEHYGRIFWKAVRYNPDFVFGTGGYAAHTGFLTRAKTVLIHDSEVSTLDLSVSRPFADAILSPDSFRTNLGENHYFFRGFKESAYLHPDVFERDGRVRAELGLGPDERFVLLRFNAFGTHHDVGKTGFTPDQRRALVERLSERAAVFVSDEAESMHFDALPAEPFDVPPALMHDALAEASLLVADTQTIVTEAALLGTPAVRSNSFVGEEDMGNFHELERAGLIRNVERFDGVIETTTELLSDETTETRWRRRRDEYLEDMVNLTGVVLEIAENGGQADRVPALKHWQDGDGGVEFGSQPPEAV